jgi:hypothetical protein
MDERERKKLTFWIIGRISFDLEEDCEADARPWGR